MNSQTKTCQNCKQAFTIDASDFAFYEKIKVPVPTWCPECRNQRRLATRNERTLYKRECDLCKKVVVSRVSPEKPYPMYCQKCWWSDDWDPLDYGREYNFERPFFEQFHDLMLKTPHVALLNMNTVNSDWVNLETDVKNCYMDIGGHFNENCAYNTFALNSKDCFDCWWIWNCEMSAGCVNCERCYKTLFSKECSDCVEAILSYDCRNCTNIFGCAGLRNKQYYIFNEPYSKDEYFKFLSEHSLSSRSNIQKMKMEAYKIWQSIPHRFAIVVNATNSIGHKIVNSKNVQYAWEVERSENSKYLYLGTEFKESYDATRVGWAELSYETANGGGFYNSKFTIYQFDGGDGFKNKSSAYLEYCNTVPRSSYSFGCVNMKGKKYCILNKQYTKEEYEKLIPRIKKHMNDMPYVDKKGRVYKYGEFFPIELSPFAYNETVAQEYFPLSDDDAKSNGYPWESGDHAGKYDISDYNVPDDIDDVGDDILKKVLKCENTGKAYRVIPMELQFYRSINLSIPEQSPAERHKNRIKQLLPYKLWHRKCHCAGTQSDNKVYQNTTTHTHHGTDHCPNEFETSYAPDRPEIVYCEECYRQEVV